MIKTLFTALNMVAALHCYKRQKYQRAKNYADRALRTTNQNDAVVLAFAATLSILNRRSDIAREYFIDSLIVAKNGYHGDDLGYIENYCNYYVCLIDGKTNCDKLRERSIVLAVSQKVSNWLQFPVERID